MTWCIPIIQELGLLVLGLLVLGLLCDKRVTCAIAGPKSSAIVSLHLCHSLGQLLKAQWLNMSL